jgi:hypothetical protein
MRGRLFSLALAVVAGSFASPLPASAAPITCPATGAICIDESVEGQNPTVFAPSEPIGEGGNVSFAIPASSVGSITLTLFGLTEPGSKLLADAISEIVGANDLGQIAIHCCTTATEDGTFQLTGNFFEVNRTILDLYLNSPEPSQADIGQVLMFTVAALSLVLFGAALVGFRVIRRKRRLASRRRRRRLAAAYYEFMT